MDSSNIIVPENWIPCSESLIKVVGVGGGGCNAVDTMNRQGIQDVEFVICNTDRQSLDNNSVTNRLYLGNKGLGAGCDPERGRRAAVESADKIKKMFADQSEMVFITAGMGGGTGTGAAPIIAQIAKELGKLTVGVVTLPFRDEGESFLKRALIGIKELRKHVDSLLIIDNQKLYDVFGELRAFEAFPRANEVLNTAVKSIAEIITKTGFINVDFADVKMVMKDSGMAIMGIGTASGPDRAAKAVEMAFESPLLNDCDLNTASGVLVNISSGKENGLTMIELNQIMEYVNSYTGTPEKFKRGVVLDESLKDEISVTIVATGFKINNLPQIDIGDPDTIVLGSGSPFSQESISTTRLTYPNQESTLQEQKQEAEMEPAETSENGSEAWVYRKPKGKPALIIEPGDDITKLEREPAYLRRERLLGKEEESRQEEAPSSAGMKIELSDGIDLTGDNSYLHQTQD